MSINPIPLFGARELLFAWTVRTIRARYQQSFLGWFWAIVQPAASVAIYTLIFTAVVSVDTGGTPYAVFSYVAVVPWTLLSASLTDMTNSLVGNMSLVQKIYFPREILPISALFARLMDFGVAASLLIVLMAIYGLPLFPLVWVYLVPIIMVQLLLITGLGLACAAFNVLYRDGQSLLTLGLQLWFYASPIIYPVTLVPEAYRPLYYLNPMTGILQSYRDVLIAGSQPGPYFLVSTALAGVIALLGYWVFKRTEPLFADII